MAAEKGHVVMRGVVVHWEPGSVEISLHGGAGAGMAPVDALELGKVLLLAAKNAQEARPAETAGTRGVGQPLPPLRAV